MGFLIQSIRTAISVPFLSHNVVPFGVRTLASRASKLREIEKRLGLPEKPKAPLTPYFRFMQEQRINPEYSTKSAVEVTKAISNIWRSLDDAKKEKYKREFDAEKLNYNKQVVDYKSKVSKEQLEKLNFEKRNLREEKEKLIEKKELKNVRNKLGKPKRPLPSAFIFAQELREKSPGKLTADEITKKYNELSSAERQVYVDKALKLSKEYNKKLIDWEEKMVKSGRMDMVRLTSPLVQKQQKQKKNNKPKTSE